jgi:hypothetical protein
MPGGQVSDIRDQVTDVRYQESDVEDQIDGIGRGRSKIGSVSIIRYLIPDP